MISRQEFLKRAGCIVAGVSLVPIAHVLPGCTPAVLLVEGRRQGNRVSIPFAQLPDLSVPYAYARVAVDTYPNPFILFRQEDGEYWAVLSTCSHSGCEVKKLRTQFECPCHGSEYDTYGRVLRGPALAPLDAYPAQLIGDSIEFELEGTYESD